MKYAPKKVFILENNEYKELGYDEFCKMNLSEEKERHFITVQGSWIEVSELDKKRLLKDRNRYDYTERQRRAYVFFSLDEMVIEEGKIEECIPDETDCGFEDSIIQNMMIEKLVQALSSLTGEEQMIIELIYYKNMSQRVAAKVFGISQPALKKRLDKVHDKLRNLMNS